jgi:glutamate dehydrogenase
MLREILTTEGALPGSHDHKEIVSIFNMLPKDELFAATATDVRADVRTAMSATATDDVAVSVRPRGDGLSALVVVPRERLSPHVRSRIRALLEAALGVAAVAAYVVDDEARALLSFAFAEGAKAPDDEALETLRRTIERVIRSWEERLADALVTRHGEHAGRRLASRYRSAFPADYRVAVPPERAADDVDLLEAARTAGTMRAALVADAAGAEATALRVYLSADPLPLSVVVPLLENVGLRALGEDQVVVTPRDGGRLFIRSFSVQDRAGRAIDVAAAGTRLLDTLTAVRAGHVADDVLNRLVLEGGLDWRAVDALRTYAGHAVQAGLAPRAVVLGVLASYPEPARRLFDCFAARFAPDGAPADARELRQRFVESLEAVTVLRDDVLLRALLDTIEATVRTNFFAPGGRERIAIKIRSTDLAHLPRPRPLFEVYVHGPQMEGLHLRAGKVARGGIRASDRPEDFRTELLGLMKTQTVKNAVIVPVGAKGGFVVTGGASDPQAVATAYDTLIHGLLDVTDNLVGGQVTHPAGVVVLDDDDPYLVVAADKGTASFSDRANRIALERGFWLGDAFASGGSHGYDHKALGITARGAWECVRTHFRELGIDADTSPLTVAAIGDPSGDVFGNGMLQSSHLRLRAAFNHRHVFLDPEPDPAASFAERERLFRAGLGWDAYDPAKLSPGGAILPRAAKRVVLSPEARQMLGLPASETTGERLVQAVLALDTALLFNGGIGTYVKAAKETDAEVGDPANDRVRIDATALRARVVAEGGNLGFTQRARVDYALAGGRIDTDAIDNSAGVDLSDHEVNLKICLQPSVEKGIVAPETRNDLLQAVGVDVVPRVLAHNRRQSRLLGFDQIRSRTRLADFVDLMGELERTAGLDRTLEALPSRDELRGRRGAFLGLTRPELAVLTAYTKIHLQREILASSLPADPLLEAYLVAYFPPAIGERYPHAVRKHRLRREIVATEVANALVDHVGTTFVSRLARDTGAGAAEVVWAWAITWRLAGGDALVAAVETASPALDVESTCQLALEAMAERVGKWIIANVDASRPAADVVADLGRALGAIRAALPEWLAGSEAETFHKRASELGLAGLPPALARELATAEWLVGPLDVVTVARQAGVEPAEAGACYYALGQHIDFAWLLARLGETGDDDRWQRRAAEGLTEDLLRARRRLTRRSLRDAGGALPERPLAAVQALLRDLRAAPRTGLAALQVVVHEIRRLSEEVHD